MSRNANAIALQTDEYKIQVKAEYLPYKRDGAWEKKRGGEEKKADRGSILIRQN